MTGDWYDPVAMERAATDQRPPFPEPPGGDQVVVLHGIPWAQYDALCRAREWKSGPRLSYLDGSLEIVSPGRRHEVEKKLLARLIEVFALEMAIDLNAFGSETFRKKAEEAGVEPDECYSVGHARKLPDFAIEVVETSGGIDKLEVYRRLGIREVWFFIDARIYVYGLVRGRYRLRSRSKFLETIDLGDLARIVTSTDPERQTEAVRAYRKSLRDKTPSRR